MANRIANNFIRFVLGIVVEPIGFAAFLGTSCYIVSQQAGLYEVFCDDKYHSDPKVTCKAGPPIGETKYAETYVQNYNSYFNIYTSLCYMVPSAVVSLYLGAFGDIHGRKVPILMGLFGTVFGIFGYLLVVGNRDVPAYIVLVSDFLAGFTGFLVLVPSMCMAYISDVTTDPEFMTIRFVVFQVTQSAGGAIGGLLAGEISKHLSLAYLGMIGMCIVIGGYVWGLFRVPEIPPQVMRKRCEEDAKRRGVWIPPPPPASGDRGPLPPPKIQMEASCRGILAMLASSIRVYLKPRAGHKRAYLICLFLIGVFFISVDAGTGMVTALFVMKDPLSWGPPQLGPFMSFTIGIGIGANFISIFLFKKVLKMGEVAISLVALISLFLRLVVTMLVGLVWSYGWMMYVANGVGLISRLIMPSMQSFATQLVEPDEVGKLFAGGSIAMDIGMLVGTVVNNLIYAATEETHPWVIFAVGAGETILLFLLVLWVYLMHRREKRLGII